MEHVLLQCNYAQEIWKLAPILWDGLNDMRYNFWKRQEKLLEARTRKDGMKHRANNNILWQICKIRNSRFFNKDAKDGRVVMSTASKEWDDFDQTNKGIKGISKRKQMNLNMKQEKEKMQ